MKNELDELRKILKTTRNVYQYSIEKCKKKTEEYEQFMKSEHNFQYKLLEEIEKLNEKINEIIRKEMKQWQKNKLFTDYTNQN